MSCNKNTVSVLVSAVTLGGLVAFVPVLGSSLGRSQKLCAKGLSFMGGLIGGHYLLNSSPAPKKSTYYNPEVERRLLNENLKENDLLLQLSPEIADWVREQMPASSNPNVHYIAVREDPKYAYNVNTSFVDIPWDKNHYVALCPEFIDAISKYLYLKKNNCLPKHNTPYPLALIAYYLDPQREEKKAQLFKEIEEIKAILEHESAHILNQDAKSMVITDLSCRAFSVALTYIIFTSLGIPIFNAPLLAFPAIVGNMASCTLVLYDMTALFHYYLQRQREYAADDRVQHIQAIIRFFEKHALPYEKAISWQEHLLSTHPQTQNRINRMKKRLKEAENTGLSPC